MITPCRTATGPAGTGSQTTDTTGRILRVTTINGFAATAAGIAIEGKTAIAADQFIWIIRLWNNMNRPANQADRCHFRLVPDAVTFDAILFEQLLGSLPVNCFHFTPRSICSTLCKFAAGFETNKQIVVELPDVL